MGKENPDKKSRVLQTKCTPTNEQRILFATIAYELVATQCETSTHSVCAARVGHFR